MVFLVIVEVVDMTDLEVIRFVAMEFITVDRLPRASPKEKGIFGRV